MCLLFSGCAGGGRGNQSIGRGRTSCGGVKRFAVRGVLFDVNATQRIAARAARRRLIRDTLALLGPALTIGASAALVLLLVDRLIGAGLPAVVIVLPPILLAVLTVALLAWRRRRAPLRAAAEVDAALGLQDRLSSGLEFISRGNGDPFAAVAIEDGERTASAVRLREAIPIRLGRSWIAWPILSALVLVGALFLPTMRLLEDQEAAARAGEEAMERETAAEQIRAAGEKVRQRMGPEDGADPSAAGADDLEMLDEIAKQLSEGGGDPDEARSQAASRLQELAQRYEREAEKSEQRFESLEDRLSGVEPPAEESPAAPFAEALRRGDLERAEESLGDVERRLNEMTPEEREALARDLNDLAESLRREASEPGADAQPSADEVLREQGVSEEAGSELQGETDPERIRERLEQEGVDPEAAETLADRVAEANQREQAEQEAQRDAEQLAQALEEAARDAQRPDQPEPPQPTPEEPAPQEPKPDQQPPQDPQQDQPPQDQSGETPTEQSQSREGQESSPGQEQQGAEPSQQPGQQQSQDPGEQGQQEQRSEQAGEPGQEGQAGQEQQPGAQPQPTPGEQPGDQSQPGQEQPGQQPGEQPGQEQQGQEQRPGEEQPGPEQAPGQQQQPGEEQRPGQEAPSGQEGQQQPQPTPGGQEGQPQPQGQAGQDQGEPAGEQDQQGGQPSPAGEGEEGQAPGASPQEGAEPGGGQGGVEKAREALRRLREQRGRSQDQRESSEELREEARRLMEQMSPEEREQAERWAQQRAREQREAAPPAAREEPASRIEAVDARKPGEGGREQVIAEWESGRDAPREPGTTTQPAGERVRDAAEAAERALERQPLPPRQADLVREYFRRFAESAEKGEAPSPEDDGGG